MTLPSSNSRAMLTLLKSQYRHRPTNNNIIHSTKLEMLLFIFSSPHIAPACLPQRSQDFSGTRCWVTGWGKDAFGTGGRYQNILKVQIH